MEEIKASDIMIDNLIYRKYWNPEPGNERYSYSVEKVIGIYKDTIYCTSIDRKEVFKLKDVYSIPLTEDILLKCGFERKKFGTDIYNLKDGWLNFSFGLTIWKDGRLFYDWIGGNIEVKYLHQLQNLFKILTGNDLKVEL